MHRRRFLALGSGVVGASSFVGASVLAGLVTGCSRSAFADPPDPARAPPPTPPAPSTTTPTTSEPMAPPRFDPSRTWMLSVGVLQFARPDLYDAFPTDGRQDDVLCDALIARGTPSAQIVRLRDAQATHTAILAQLDAVLARVRPGDDFIFYYAGHGVQDEHGTTYFAASDGGDTYAECIPHSAVLDALDARFRGRYALVLADCCYSGAFSRLLGERSARKPYASLTSSLASEISTDHWTFTESIIAAIRGEPRVDQGHDASITLAELAAYTEEEMAFAEGQLAPFATGTVPTSLVLSDARGLPFARYGERVMARWSDGTLYPAHITGEGDGGRLRVRFIGETEDYDDLFAPRSLRPYAPSTHAVGSHVEVRWNGTWYPAVVRASRLGVHRIHYDGFDEAWDEWVSGARIRAPR